MRADEAPVAASPDLSLVLATVGRWAELPRLLDSLRAQTFTGFELVVIDQNEDDRLVPLLQEARASGLALRHLRSPRGLSRARNRGLAEARGRWVAFPDDDCWYEPDALAQAIQALRTRPDEGGVIARWVEHDLACGPCQGQDPLSLAEWLRFRGGDASSITLFLRTATVRAVGGFDERLGLGAPFSAGEETDLVLRLLAGGHTLRRSVAVGVHHAFDPDPSTTGAALMARSLGTGALYAKHPVPRWVVVRGLVAPLLQACAKEGSATALNHAAHVSWGRLLGWWRWQRLAT